MSKSSNEWTLAGGESSGLTDTERHRLLTSSRRRVTLAVLAQRSHPIDLDDLASAVAVREEATNEDDPADINRVATSLHHNHLPRIADLGLIEYDRTANRVTTRQFER